MRTTLTTSAFCWARRQSRPNNLKMPSGGPVCRTCRSFANYSSVHNPKSWRWLNRIEASPMSDSPANPSELIHYQTEDGRTRLEVRLQFRNWATQQMREFRVNGFTSALSMNRVD